MQTSTASKVSATPHNTKIYKTIVSNAITKYKSIMNLLNLIYQTTSLPPCLPACLPAYQLTNHNLCYQQIIKTNSFRSYQTGKILKYSINWTAKAVGSFIYSIAKYAIFSIFVNTKLLII